VLIFPVDLDVSKLKSSMIMRVYEKQLSRLRLTLMDGGTSLHLRLGLEPFAPASTSPSPRRSLRCLFMLAGIP
jgi:hypothetical protein